MIQKKWILMISMLVISCEKKLSIADFEDDFSFYKSELRIEAILDPVNFMNSVVRVDKTILVTDTTLFNGRDDNGDWVSYSDINGNGKWDDGEPLNDDLGTGEQDRSGNMIGRGNGKPDSGEPHVDDYLEILSQVHDSTMASVVLYHEATMELAAEFEWVTVAGEFEFGFGSEHGPDSDNFRIEKYTYGGYKPKSEYTNTVIIPGKPYLFRIITSSGDVISGSTIPIAQPEFRFGDTFWNTDTVIVDTLIPTYPMEMDTLFWITQPEGVWAQVTAYEYVDEDSTKKITSFVMAPNKVLDDGNYQYSIQMDWFPIEHIKYEISVLDPNYGTYRISSLPLRDEQLSNLRDQDDNVVLGVAASLITTSVDMYLKIR